MAKKYSEKLRDPRWQKKRLEILQRDEWKCQACGDKEAPLHIHHIFYDIGKDPWDYKNRHLITLCEDCHESERTEFYENSKELISAMKYCGFMSSDLVDFIHGFSEIKLQEQPAVISSAYSHAMIDPEVKKIVLEEYEKSKKSMKSI